MQSLIWDNSTNTLSSSRVMLLFGGLLFLGMTVVVTIIVLHSYFHFGPDHIPNLSWYLYGTAGDVMMSVPPYLSNRATAGRQDDIKNELDQGEEAE